MVLQNMELATVFSIQNLEPATAIILAIGAFLVGITALSIYTSFGPPAKELDDPFEDHED